jgi:hypothetical protein
MKSTSFWDITPCSLVAVYRRLGGKYRLQLFAAEPYLRLLFNPEDGGDIFLRNVG